MLKMLERMQKLGTFDQQDVLHKVSEKLNNAKRGQWFELKVDILMSALDRQDITDYKGINIHHTVECGNISIIAIF